MRIILYFIVFSFHAFPAFAMTSMSVSQWDITFYFEKEMEIGQYANGDYWVVGPVVINRITPDFDGHNNGWEVNPTVQGKHGFQDNCYGGNNFDPNLVPELPYTAHPGQSIVKTTPDKETVISGYYRPCIKTASVLTVVAKTPDNNGKTVFRPPYVGANKTNYSTQELRFEILPSLEPITEAPTLDDIKNLYQRVQLDHKSGGTGRALRPSLNMPNYGGDIGKNEADVALRLMLNDPIEQKMETLIVFVQAGIDIHAMVLQGQYWPRGGGEQPCHTLPYAFAAVMLNDQEMMAKIKQVSENKLMYNDYTLQRGKSGMALWGDKESWSEENYWRRLVVGTGSKTLADPYGYIDGGYLPGSGYQYCCTSMIWKGLTLSFHLMPELKKLWANELLFNYADRWVNSGTISQPDPCAPHDGKWENYSITFGPDPKNPGECIYDNNTSDGIGRFPERHGISLNSGHRQSSFQNAMWIKYRRSLEKPSGFNFSPKSN